MSVDYFSCQCCGDARYEEAIISCEKCGASICNECIVLYSEDNNDCEYYFPNHVRNDDGELKSKHCPFCTGKSIDDQDLLKFIYKKYNIDEDQIKKEFLSNMA